MTLCVNEYPLVSLNQPDKLSNDRRQLFPECWVGVLRNECTGRPTEKSIANVFAGMLISTERIVRSQQAFSFDKTQSVLFAVPLSSCVWLKSVGSPSKYHVSANIGQKNVKSLTSCWVSRLKSNTNTINYPVSIVICNHDCCLHGHTKL